MLLILHASRVAHLTSLSLAACFVVACSSSVTIDVDSGVADTRTSTVFEDAPTTDQGTVHNPADPDAAAVVVDGSTPVDATTTAPDASATLRMPIDVAVFDARNPAAPGDQTPGYVSRLDTMVTFDGQQSRVLSAPTGASTRTWAATTWTIDTGPEWAGKRVRLRCRLRTDAATDVGFAWLRLDLEAMGYVIDNMQIPTNRSFRGAHDWTYVELVLDVPDGAWRFAFGSGLIGRGNVWIADIVVEEVDRSVAVTPHFRG